MQVFPHPVLPPMTSTSRASMRRQISSSTRVPQSSFGNSSCQSVSVKESPYLANLLNLVESGQVVGTEARGERWVMNDGEVR